MAGRQRLTTGTRRGLLAVVAAVLVGHFAVLHWASGLRMETGLLRPMAPPMYTRVLAPRAPAPVAAAPAVAAPRKPRPKPAGRIAPAPSVPRTATTTTAQDTPPEPPQTAASEAAAAAAADAVSMPEAAATARVAQASAAASASSAPQATASAPAVAASAAASAATAVADSWPADTRLRYRLGGTYRGGPLYGSGRVLWQRQGTRYQVRVEVEVPPFASFSMTSQGEVDAVTLQPAVYEEMRNGKPRGLRIGEREVQLANATRVARPDGLQDTASQFVELSHRFATGRERLEVGRAVTLWMARPGAVDLWTYDITEREVLRTGLGPVEAFHLKPRMIANPHGNILAEMWFAPTLQYLPVRVRVSMGDEAQVDLLVDAIDQR
ncbi:MAG: DUF3108 domain-containing protein [Ramlibacter sp.]